MKGVLFNNSLVYHLTHAENHNSAPHLRKTLCGAPFSWQDSSIGPAEDYETRGLRLCKECLYLSDNTGEGEWHNLACDECGSCATYIVNDVLGPEYLCEDCAKNRGVPYLSTHMRLVGRILWAILPGGKAVFTIAR